MIIEYHRPDTRDAAVALLSRKDPETIVLGGGLYINEVIQAPVAVVDVQALAIDGIKSKGEQLELGGGLKLQSLLEARSLPDFLGKAIRHQENYNRRQVASLAGTLVAASGRSPIPAVFLALDAVVVLRGKGKTLQQLHLGDFLPLRKEHLAGKLLTEVVIPVQVQGAYHYVARSPADLPIAAAAAVRWPSGRTRVVLAGYGDQPRLVFDGPDSQGAELAARDAFSEASDHWASADYRADAAAALTRRCLADLGELD